MHSLPATRPQPRRLSKPPEKQRPDLRLKESGKSGQRSVTSPSRHDTSRHRHGRLHGREALTPRQEARRARGSRCGSTHKLPTPSSAPRGCAKGWKRSSAQFSTACRRVFFCVCACVCVLLNVLGCRLTYQGQAETNAEAWFSIALRPRKPEGSLGRPPRLSHSSLNYK